MSPTPGRELLQSLAAGERPAYLRLGRRVTGWLAAWRAYDFRDEWPDLVQEVLLVAAAAAREGRLRNDAALLGYTRSVARHKFLDRLRASVARRESSRIAWDELLPELERHQAALETTRPEFWLDVRRALDRLPDRQREVVLQICVERRTYDEAAAETRIPLGSLKRYLREGLGRLRKELADAL